MANFFMLLLFFSCSGNLYADINATLSVRLSKLSAETYVDAIRYEAGKSPLSRMAILNLDHAAATIAESSGSNPIQSDLFEKAKDLIPLSTLPPENRTATLNAIDAARAYLAPDNSTVCAASSLPEHRVPPSDLMIFEGGSLKAGTSGASDLIWKGADEYISSRLGPLRAVLDILGNKDRIILSNLPPQKLPTSILSNGEFISINLPISGYAKTIWLLTSPDGTKTLLLADFQGATFLRHYELLIRHYFHSDRLPVLFAAESPSAYEEHYRGLLRVAEANPNISFSGMEGLIVGYAESFRAYWSSYSVTSATDPQNDWKIEVYKPAQNGTWGVVSAHSSYYGEILGKNLRYLVEASTGIKTVLIAGSGGSLAPNALYSITYPSHILTASGQVEPNILASAINYTAHASVASPLEETRAWAKSALSSGVATVDVEMSPAAAALSGLGLQLGFAVLVTDFPIDRPVFDVLRRASFADQDSTAKYRGLESHVHALEKWIQGEPPPGWQPLEKKLKRTLEDQSAQNLREEEKGLGPLSADEKRLLAKLTGYFSSEPPTFSVRMSSSRAQRVLEDQALLSSALVSSLKGAQISPFTPDYEQETYSAYGYIFGTLSYWDGPEKYGQIVLRIKHDSWNKRAWATRRSAMRALAIGAEKAGIDIAEAATSPMLIKKAGELFASWIVTPRDLPRALALQIIGELRQLPAKTADDFLRSPPSKIPDLIKRYDIGWLEGKICGYLQPEEIEALAVPHGFPEVISSSAGKLGIKLISPK